MHLCNATLRIVLGVQEINILVRPCLQPVINLQILEVVGQGHGIVKRLFGLEVVVEGAGRTLGQDEAFIRTLITRMIRIKFRHTTVGPPGTFKVECLSTPANE